MTEPHHAHSDVGCRLKPAGPPFGLPLGSRSVLDRWGAHDGVEGQYLRFLRWGLGRLPAVSQTCRPRDLRSTSIAPDVGIVDAQTLRHHPGQGGLP
jgi:hypothetical protein